MGIRAQGNPKAKYKSNPDATSERLFGKSDVTVTDYMYKTVTK